MALVFILLSWAGGKGVVSRLDWLTARASLTDLLLGRGIRPQVLLIQI